MLDMPNRDCIAVEHRHVVAQDRASAFVLRAELSLKIKGKSFGQSTQATPLQHKTEQESTRQ